MDIFDVLSLVSGLSLFLFGMNLMGQALERRAGGKLRSLIGKLTTNKAAGLLTGLGVTAVIQSSSATTVMVVGFVNSGLMTLKQAINVIMGANIGTTVTAWILSLSGIESDNLFVQLLKPSSFTPVLALIGIILYMFCKDSRKKDSGTILLGFTVLMFGMETMTDAVSGLANIPEFQNLFLLFKNPVLGVLAGAVLTAIIQSSSASVGILQALAITGQVSYSAAIPIIMGQNIGTCITAMLSSVGANKNAKRAALVHLSFNIIGTVILTGLFCLLQTVFRPAIFNHNATLFGIAVVHSAFNILCTVLMLPLSGALEKFVNIIVPDSKTQEVTPILDERLFATPSVAVERCHAIAVDMANISIEALKDGLKVLHTYNPDLAVSIRETEEKTDHYEDILGTSLVKISACQINEADSAEAAKLLKIIGDFERISDHAVNLLESAEEIKEKQITFTQAGEKELFVISSAVNEILDLALTAFLNNDTATAATVEPLEYIIGNLKEKLRTHHITRLQQGECSIDAGFIWSDLLTNLKRTSDHCSNIAGCILEMAHNNMNLHESLKELRNDSADFKDKYEKYAKKYSLKGL